MADEQCQNNFWGDLSYNNQPLPSDTIHYEAGYDVSSFGIQTPQNIYYTPMLSQLLGTVTTASPTDWYAGPPASVRSTGSDRTSPSPEIRNLEPFFQTLDKKTSSTNNAVKKRRQQNRNSQMAFRQRTKKLIEDLRHEVTEYSVYSQEMYQTLQSLREMTRTPVSTIDRALSKDPPINYRYLEGPRSDSNEARRSSRSSDATQLPREKRVHDG